MEDNISVLKDKELKRVFNNENIEIQFDLIDISMN